MIQFDDHIFQMGWNHQPAKSTWCVFSQWLLQIGIPWDENRHFSPPCGRRCCFYILFSKYLISKSKSIVTGFQSSAVPWVWTAVNLKYAKRFSTQLAFGGSKRHAFAQFCKRLIWWRDHWHSNDHQHFCMIWWHFRPEIFPRHHFCLEVLMFFLKGHSGPVSTNPAVTYPPQT